MKLQGITIKSVLCFALFLAAGSFTGCDAEPALKDKFSGDFLVGAALNYDQISGLEPKETAIIARHFNTITPENILKWQAVHPERDKYDFEPADKYAAFGEKHKMFIVGHTLIWHNQTPQWIFRDEAGNPVSREVLLERMKEHIFAVVGRYKGRINGWDVVNEAVAEDGQLRQSEWLEIIGEDYIEKAFEYARQADPDAELYYNDYGMFRQGKRERVVRLVKDLRAKGVDIEGIGMQGHWNLYYPPLDEIEASVKAFAELGVKVMITELDISVLPSIYEYKGVDISLDAELQKKLNPYPDALPDEMEDKLAKRYAELFTVFHKHRGQISRVTFWGVYDGQSWLNYLFGYRRTDYPLLFDRQYRSKPAFDAVIKFDK
ncbi:MAG: endo-1,4-beta-xylanase [Phycisphaerae bacterium]|nr:endo-1,4-beta-xylanase [Phycisphaerae bacterium]